MRPVQPPNPNTKTPRLKAPPGACDTHLHIYGPLDRYPLVAERNYDPHPRSTLDDYLKVRRTLGLERAVIVTGSGHGTNNQITLDALTRMNGKFKGLALLDPAIADSALLKLKMSGFTGFRVKSNGKGGMSFAESKKMTPRVAGFGWHVEFMSQSMAEVITAVPVLQQLKMPFVFDHVAHAEPRQSFTDHEFKTLLAILKNEEHAWINLYSFYQLSVAGPPQYRDMVGIVQAIIETRWDHVLWGTNWPHAGVRVPMPNDGDLLDFLLEAAPEEQTRNRILVDNPANLYGWSC